jgi:hypothetical protein
MALTVRDLKMAGEHQRQFQLAADAFQLLAAGLRGGKGVPETVAEELGPSLRWATATTTKTTRSPSQ